MLYHSILGTLSAWEDRTDASSRPARPVRGTLLVCQFECDPRSRPHPGQRRGDNRHRRDLAAAGLARQQIQPNLGATSYNFSPEALQDIPQGENAPLNQVLLQAPGVVQDSFGQIHLRGEHANVQYRLNGVELPEGLSVFGQALTERFAQS